ncbi:MAG: hypothetical protein ACPH10_06045 [Litorivicinaceae bacterium]
MSIDNASPKDWDSLQGCPSKPTTKEHSDGSSADYYKIPAGAEQLQDLISIKNMNAQLGEIFRATYRYGEVAHSKKLRDINKIIFYGLAERDRLIKYGE